MRCGLLLVLVTGCAKPGPWDGLFEVEAYSTATDACGEAAEAEMPESTHVAVAFGSDIYGEDRAQVHLCDSVGQCGEVPRWNGVLRKLTSRRIEGDNSEILAVERDGSTVCTLAWSHLDLGRSGRELTMEAKAWSVGITTQNSGECESEMEELQDANTPCDGYWALTARMVD
jgi:hypothetical protein